MSPQPPLLLLGTEESRCLKSHSLTKSLPSLGYKDYQLVDEAEGVSSEWAGRGLCASFGDRPSSEARMLGVPLEPLKWIFLFCFLALAGLSNWAVLAYTHDFVPREPLPDVLFKILPEQEWASRAGDWMVTTCLVCLILLLIFHSARVVVARRILFIAATLYAMRSCTLLVTQLPPGYENNTMRCRERANSSLSLFLSRLGEQTIRLGFQEKLNMLCGDLLFSGHTLVMVSCSLTVAYYLPRRWSILAWVPHLSTAFGLLCMIISRTHYTIDILIAYWLTNFVFRIYHAYCELDECLERRKSVLHQIWLLRLVGWLEENIVPGRVQNELSIPGSNLLQSLVLGPSGHHKQISISSSTTFRLP